MNKIKKLISIILAGVTLVLSGCFEDESKRKVIRVGLSSDYPPFEFVKDGEIVGFDVDLARLLAEKLDKELEIVDMEFSGLIMALKAGRVDFVMAGLTVTEPRARIIDFSDVYYNTSIAVLYKESDLIGDDLKEIKLGAQMGSIPEKWAKEHSGKEVLALAKYPPLVQELKVGRIEGVVMEVPQAKEFVKSNTGLAYKVYEVNQKEGYAIGLRKGSYLKKKMDKALRQLRATGRIDELKEKWMN